jgi:hypothetical protein
MVKRKPKKQKQTLQQLIKSGHVMTGRAFAHRIAQSQRH